MIKKLVSALLYLLCWASFSSAAIFEVPKDYPTIQEAITGSQDGDTVLVAVGVYYENIDLNGKDILLSSWYLYDSSWQTVQETVIDGSQSDEADSGSVVIFHSGESNACRLNGFTLRAGFGTLTGGTYQGGGILCCNNSNPKITNNVIKHNNSITGGGCAFMDSNPILYRNLIDNNSAFVGGGMSLDNSRAVINNCVFAFNNATDSAGALHILLCDGTVIQNSVFYKNNIETGSPWGGISCFFSFPHISYNDFYGNLGGDLGNCFEEYGDTSCCLNFNLIPCDTFFNIFRDPLFLDPAGGDFRVDPLSPLIDAGAGQSPDFPYNGIRNDIGLFEYQFLIGDSNNDSEFNVSDAYFLVRFIFEEGPPPLPLWAGDYNCDRVLDVSDIISMVNRIFFNAPGPCNDD